MIGFVLIHCQIAKAQITECEKIKYTTVPIEIVAEGTAMNRLPSGSLATPSVVNVPANQFYRSADGKTTVLYKNTAKHSVTKANLFFGFAQEHVVKVNDVSTKTLYRYNPPINRELRVERSNFAHSYTREKTENGETTIDTVHSAYNYRGSGTMVVDGCSFEIENFEIDSVFFKNDTLISSTNWTMAYSVALGASLSNEILNFDANRVLQSIVIYRAKTVKTEFVPIEY